MNFDLVKEVEDSTRCLYDNLHYLIENNKIEVHDLSEILIYLDDIWRIINENN